jgi:tol-pal system protein YbgF
MRGVLIALACALPLLAGGPGLAEAQMAPAAPGAGSAAWNALYDRIIRLEHEIRALKRQPPGNGAGNGGASLRFEGRLKALEAEIADLREELRRRLAEMERRLRRLERTAPLRGGARQPAREPQGAGEDLRLPQARAAMNTRQPALDPDLFAGGEASARMSAEITRNAGTAASSPSGEQLLGRLRAPAGSLPERPGAAQGLSAQGGTSPALKGARRLPGVPAGTAPLAGRPSAADTPAYPSAGPEMNGAAPLVPERVEAVPLPAPETRMARADADALLKEARNSFLARRYGLAERAYRAFISQAGRHPALADARYELGETYYLQGRYREAGKAYLETYKNHPDSRVAPQALLKLGLSLRRLGQKKQACKSWSLLRQRYPDSRAARLMAPREMKRAGCKG